MADNPQHTPFVLKMALLGLEAGLDKAPDICPPETEEDIELDNGATETMRTNIINEGRALTWDEIVAWRDYRRAA